MLEGGGGLYLLSNPEQFKTLFMNDATINGNVQGTISPVEVKFASEFTPALSSHDTGL